MTDEVTSTDDPNDLAAIEGLSGEDIARLKQARDSDVRTDLSPDTDEQLAAKQTATQLGDQEAVNQAGARYPDGADTPTAANVRRFPELFDQAVIDSFQEDDPNTSDDTTASDVADDESDESNGGSTRINA